eukprot:COSAG02_NODE_49009_length_330_cov_0.424242_1_plen_88_part_10
MDVFFCYAQDQDRLQAAAAARLKAINDQWKDSEEEEEEDSEEEQENDAAPSPTAASLGIDARLLQPDSGLAKPKVPSYGVGLSLGLGE